MHPIPPILFSFRPPSSWLRAWTECSTSLTSVSSHHRILWGPCGLWCCLSHGLCLPQCCCQVCMKRKRFFNFFCRESVTCLKTNRSIFIFLYKDLKILSSLLWLSVLHCLLQHEHHQCLIPLPFFVKIKKNSMNSFKFLHSVTKKKPFSRIETQLFCFIENLL